MSGFSPAISGASHLPRAIQPLRITIWTSSGQSAPDAPTGRACPKRSTSSTARPALDRLLMSAKQKRKRAVRTLPLPFRATGSNHHRSEIGLPAPHGRDPLIVNDAFGNASTAHGAASWPMTDTLPRRCAVVVVRGAACRPGRKGGYCCTEGRAEVKVRGRIQELCRIQRVVEGKGPDDATRYIDAGGAYS